MSKKVVSAIIAAYLFGVALGFNTPEPLASTILEAVKELAERLITQNPAELAWRIFFNNARAVLVVALLSPLVLAPGLTVFANGVILGIALAYAAEAHSWLAAIISIAPHGVIEVPAFIYASVVSTTFGLTLWRKLLRKGGVQLSEASLNLAKGLLISITLLAVAAFVEAFITPLFLKFIIGMA